MMRTVTAGAPLVTVAPIWANAMTPHGTMPTTAATAARRRPAAPPPDRSCRARSSTADAVIA
jgi:hypothetical protein